MSSLLTLNPTNFVEGNVQLPGSKSITNRVLLLSSLCYGTTILKNILYSDDIKYMLSALKKLGIRYKLIDNKTTCILEGNINILKNSENITLFLGNAGTAMRPLLAILSCNKNSNIVLTGEERMLERPIHHLVLALRQGGAKIKYLGVNGYPPLKILGGYNGGLININGSISSQFLSSLLMLAPLGIYDTTINIIGTLVSKPYIKLTLNLLKIFGISVIYKNDFMSFYIKGNQIYKTPGTYYIEGDASSATYFLAAAAIKGGTVNVHGLNKKSIQGDIKFSNVLKKMGALITTYSNKISCTRAKLYGIDIDANDLPDAAMTISIVALFSKNPTYIRNIYNWRVKETDRLKAMTTELKKIGANVEEGRDYLIIFPPKKFKSAYIETYNDHRIAMCFSLISLANIPITILNPTCVNKTFPNYFDVFQSICKK